MTARVIARVGVRSDSRSLQLLPLPAACPPGSHLASMCSPVTLGTHLILPPCSSQHRNIDPDSFAELEQTWEGSQQGGTTRH